MCTSLCAQDGTVTGQNSLERGDFSAPEWRLCQSRALAIPGMDERDYRAEGSFDLGINMWTV